jgi:hypothetical protein
VKENDKSAKGKQPPGEDRTDTSKEHALPTTSKGGRTKEISADGSGKSDIVLTKACKGTP